MLLEICRIIGILSSFVFKHAICFNRIWSTIKSHSVFYVFNKKHTCTSKIDCVQDYNIPIYVQHITRSHRATFVLRGLTAVLQNHQWKVKPFGRKAAVQHTASITCLLGHWVGSPKVGVQLLKEGCSIVVLQSKCIWMIIESQNHRLAGAGKGLKIT